MRDVIDSAIKVVIDHGQFVSIAKLVPFETKLAEYHGARHAIAVSSGTDALVVSLTSLGIGPGDEVITTPFTFVATFEAIARLGATAVFVDIDPVTWNLDEREVKRAITHKTKCVLTVGLFGEPSLVSAAGIPVIFDNAQSFGAKHAGLATTLSFFPSKVLGAFGDGGAILTNEDELAEKMRQLRQHGRSSSGEFSILGGNFRMDVLQAKVLEEKMNFVDQWILRRREIASFYDTALAPLANVSAPKRSNDHVCNYYVVRTKQRDDLKVHLAKASIDSRIYYPQLIPNMGCAMVGGHRVFGELSNAVVASKELLAIPLYPQLTDAELQHVADALSTFFS